MVIDWGTVTRGVHVVVVVAWIGGLWLVTLVLLPEWLLLILLREPQHCSICVPVPRQKSVPFTKRAKAAVFEMSRET